MVVYRGHTYWGRGPVKRDPATTGRLVRGIVPGCDDTGGHRDAKDEPVRLVELADVPVETAVLMDGVVYVRHGRALPTSTRLWFRAPRCTSAGRFALTAGWLGVTSSRRPRFDGDLRPPYRLEVHVTAGPARYAGVTVPLHVDTATRPRLRPRDAKTSLWRGGQLTARVTCTDGRFRALSLRVPAGS